MMHSVEKADPVTVYIYEILVPDISYAITISSTVKRHMCFVCLI